MLSSDLSPGKGQPDLSEVIGHIEGLLQHGHKNVCLLSSPEMTKSENKLPVRALTIQVTKTGVSQETEAGPSFQRVQLRVTCQRRNACFPQGEQDTELRPRDRVLTGWSPLSPELKMAAVHVCVFPTRDSPKFHAVAYSGCSCKLAEKKKIRQGVECLRVVGKGSHTVWYFLCCHVTGCTQPSTECSVRTAARGSSCRGAGRAQMIDGLP